MKKRIVAVLLALTLTAGCFGAIPSVDVQAAESNASGSELASEEASEYTYVYVGLTWDEYWENEGVYAAGNASSSTELDSNNESDKGAFDAVSRATTNHGLHRGSYQCTAIIYAKDNSTFSVAYWKDSTTAVLTDGTSITFEKGTITKPDGSTAVMDHYEVIGVKYVPVAVRAEDYEDFCSQYSVVENDGQLAGGYSENNLKSYTETAQVNENTNGLKTAVKNEDGSFTFGARKTGNGSGITGVNLKNVGDVTAVVQEANGKYGEFLRVDLKENYGDLGANMQAVKWTYYGQDSTYTNALQSYGTKFAADNWMHKSMGIQLGLTDSLRCQLPQGTDGTGYWELTVYALGYEDTTFRIQATEANIVKPSEETGDTTELAKTVKAAQSLKEADYCATSWKNLKAELEEAEEELADPHAQAVMDEAKEHLQAAIDSLQKHSFGKEYVKTAATTSSAGQMAKKCEKCGVEVLGSTIPKLEGTENSGTTKLKTTTAKLSAVKKTSMKVSWKKISGASGYQVQYSTSSKFKKTVTVKVSSKKTAATISKLKKNKKYYVRVRSYKKASGKTTYSSWSKAVSKTTKKK
jgi:hypothetical protein